MIKIVCRSLLKYVTGIMLSAYGVTVIAQGSPVTGMAEVNLGNASSGE